MNAAPATPGIDNALRETIRATWHLWSALDSLGARLGAKLSVEAWLAASEQASRAFVAYDDADEVDDEALGAVRQAVVAAAEAQAAAARRIADCPRPAPAVGRDEEETE